ncbi:hypothetical protein [Chitinibacter tainanensis]|uniref:hypothetical protein n=1 Tax=Chitinibacter tainanensis TaxID=230667 RepID=UPI0005573F09|nr:hypothetical protein [Chitinibacter tainanensis]
MSNQVSFIAYGYSEQTQQHNSNVWQGAYDPAQDLKGRGYPDWIPDNSTALAPPSPTAKFVNGQWK